MQQRAPVFFIGAGPGDPELITLKGRRLLDSAQVIVHAGSLVNPALLAGLRAELHDSSSMTLEEIVQVMAQAWNQGRQVARLHTGDPSVYGAIREQIRELRRMGIPCEVVPGVSSAFAAAAALGAELTAPEISQSVILTRRAGRTPVPEGESLDRLAATGATLCIFLSVSLVDQVVADLLRGGLPPDTPAAVVERASWPEERILVGSLENIAAQVGKAGIRKTAMILVGRALGDQATDSRLYHRDFSHGGR